MKKTNIPVLIQVLTLLTLMLSTATGAFAQEPTPAAEEPSVEHHRIRDWSLRFGFIVAETDGATSIVVDPGAVDVRLSGGGGGFVNLEKEVTQLLGLEFGLIGIGTDMRVSADSGLKHWGTGVEILSMGALTLGANFHMVKTEVIDVYAGPMLSFNNYNKSAVHAGCDDDWWPNKHHDHHWVSVSSKNDSELTWGAKAGIDIFLNKKKSWTLNGSLSYIDAACDFEEESSQGRSSIDLDPIMFGFGVGYRF